MCLVFRMKLLHIVPSFYPATYWGGPIFSVYDLCNHIVDNHSVHLTVLTTNAAGPRLKDKLILGSNPVRQAAGYDVYYFRRVLPNVISLSLLLNLNKFIKQSDIVHLTGVYSFTTIPTLFFCLINKKPIVWSPRGSLQDWTGTSKGLLKKYWVKFCNHLLLNIKCTIHTTVKEEKLESGKKITNASYAVIPNGVELPAQITKKYRSSQYLRLLFIGRLHEKKGIENLLRSFLLLKSHVYLDIYGTGESRYVESLKKLTTQLGLEKLVTFYGHVVGEEKTKAFSRSDVCIVPSYTENFGMVIAEALSHNVPVIASKGTPWQGLVDHGCGLWVDNTPVALARAIENVFDMDLPLMGSQGRAWMENEFEWKTVADKMTSLYIGML